MIPLASETNSKILLLRSGAFGGNDDISKSDPLLGQSGHGYSLPAQKSSISLKRQVNLIIQKAQRSRRYHRTDQPGRLPRPATARQPVRDGPRVLTSWEMMIGAFAELRLRTKREKFRPKKMRMAWFNDGTFLRSKIELSWGSLHVYCFIVLILFVYWHCQLTRCSVFI